MVYGVADPGHTGVTSVTNAVTDVDVVSCMVRRGPMW